MKKILILGAGGHAKVLIDALQLKKSKIHGIIDIDPKLHGKKILGVKVLGGEDLLVKKFTAKNYILVNAIGSTQDTTSRKNIFLKFKKLGFSFLTVIHPKAVVARSAKLGEGVQILALAHVGVETTIEDNVIVNNLVNIDHECNIGAHVHLAPGVTLSGLVHVGSGSHLGTAAVAIQGIKIGADCLIAAGSVVVRDIPSEKRVQGVPAHEFN